MWLCCAENTRTDKRSGKFKFRSFAVFAFVFVVSIVDALPAICTDTRRRRLTDDDWIEILQSCSEVEYETSLYVQKHVFVVATPVKNNNLHPDCPNIAMDQAMDQNDADHQIRNVNVHNFTLLNGVDPITQPHLSIGPFSLAEIASAFHNVRAHVAADPNRMKHYDVVMENCGDFPARMMTFLNVDFDKEMVQFLANQLQRTHRTLARDIRTNPNAVNLLTNSSRLDALTDLELIELLVESKVKHLYNSSATPFRDIYNDPSKHERHRRTLLANDEDAPKTDRRLSQSNCGRWYSSICLERKAIFATMLPLPIPLPIRTLHGRDLKGYMKQQQQHLVLIGESLNHPLPRRDKWPFNQIECHTPKIDTKCSSTSP